MKSYKFKIRRPAKNIVEKFEQTLELCRELYNAGLQERREAWNFSRISINYFSQANQLSEIKETRKDLKTVHAQVLQDVLRRLDKSFKAFFNRVQKGEKAGFPRFKGQKRFDSFCFPQSGFKLIGDKLKLSKIGSFRIRLSREIKGQIKTCKIKREVDGWYVVFTAETENNLLPKTGKTIGIDVGLINFATLSDGEVVDNPHFLKAAEKRLKRANRSVSKKKKGSSNRRKAVLLLRKQHLKIKRQRQDFLHKISRSLINRFDEIGVEDLQIKNIVKNHFLAKSVMDASWGTFLQMLVYKAESAGRRVWKVDPKNTSQNCSKCGVKIQKSLKMRVHICNNCETVLDRDHNAAINIKGRADLLGMSLVGATDEPRI